MKVLTTSLALVLLASAPVFAQDTGSNTGMGTSTTTGATGNTTGTTGDTGTTGSSTPSFTTLDTDQSGVVSEDEFTASGFSDADLFGDLDTNGDGSLSTTELSAWSGGDDARTGMGSSGTGATGGGTGTGASQ